MLSFWCRTISAVNIITLKRSVSSRKVSDKRGCCRNDKFYGATKVALFPVYLHLKVFICFTNRQVTVSVCFHCGHCYKLNKICELLH